MVVHLRTLPNAPQKRGTLLLVEIGELNVKCVISDAFNTVRVFVKGKLFVCGRFVMALRGKELLELQRLLFLHVQLRTFSVS